jgi:hypothetical protein
MASIFHWMRKRYAWRHFLTLAILMILGMAMPAHGSVRTICSTHAAQQEKAKRIPTGLVHAVALAESGRWLKQDKTTKPWPWTVTSGSDSFYLSSKEAAIAKVRELQASGRTNIDVGCMQINLHYHPDAFASLEEAFDPDRNVAYGTKFLRDLRMRTRSWGKATAFYHSQDRVRGTAYRVKVYKLWRKLRGRKAPLATASHAQQAPPGGLQKYFKNPVRRPLFSNRPSYLWKRDAIPVLRGG